MASTSPNLFFFFFLTQNNEITIQILYSSPSHLHYSFKVQVLYINKGRIQGRSHRPTPQKQKRLAGAVGTRGHAHSSY